MTTSFQEQYTYDNREILALRAELEKLRKAHEAHAQAVSGLCRICHPTSDEPDE